MIRRLAALTAVVALLAGACGSSAPALTDPKDILSQSAATLSALKSVHIHVDVAGSVKIDLLGTGSASALDLTGTTADVDVDLPNSKAHASFSVPAMFGLGGDFIQIGADQYTKVSLAGPKYTKNTTAPSTASAAPTDPKALVKQVQDALTKLSSPPAKGADEKVGDQDCYRVTLKLTAADLSGAGASLPPGMTGDGTVDVWVRKNDLRPARLVAAINGGDQGSLTLTITLSNFDATISIDAPPADQIAP